MSLLLDEGQKKLSLFCGHFLESSFKALPTFQKSTCPFISFINYYRIVLYFLSLLSCEWNTTISGLLLLSQSRPLLWCLTHVRLFLCFNSCPRKFYQEVSFVWLLSNAQRHDSACFDGQREGFGRTMLCFRTKKWGQLFFNTSMERWSQEQMCHYMHCKSIQSKIGIIWYLILFYAVCLSLR